VKLKSVFRVLLAMFVISTGTLHFVRPDPFVAIVPDYLPQPLLLVYVSGFFEILGGIGLMIPHIRRPAGWGLMALFIAVFPANIHMALHQLPFNGVVHPIGNWMRLPFQAVLIAWAYWVMRGEAPRQNKSNK
jgi:uncharacterized membrane protein